ncbi:MAG: hypothetical protein OQK12_16785 [Motiliproteus sp.]|nr:hypothetical protein [Motiliproteus sp.]MCW9051246.1 hypothetical protein [Motiliproteus sp.]
MSVQVAFQKSDGSLIHKLICWWTKSEFAHCEVVVDGIGYGMKGSIDGLHTRKEFLSWQWDFVAVDWDKYQVLKFIDQNKDTKYDFSNFRARVGRLFGDDNPLKDDCAEWVVLIAAHCHDARFHGRNPSKYKPADIYQKLTGKRK